ncbi:hypothetical protein [Chromobacterium violaceum]|uniref:hypothetical protein n=1 Tax=Chromobacterium violaceum TaxID=536 RepID=UPI001CE1E7E1|nr:hypothetical protein [Chromobacterium violaceum]
MTCTQERFLHDVADHQMEIIRDDGVYRHIRFKRPGDSAFYFDLHTWPGCLCFTGDMETFVFSRLRDMFDFFRLDQRYAKSGEIRINRGYWAEKLLASPRRGHMEFDASEFRRVINQYRSTMMRRARELGISKDERRGLWESIDDQVLGLIDEGESRASIAAYDFGHRIGQHEFYFQDLFEHNFERYTFHFTWACYAIAWGIQQYDSAKEQAKEAA